MLSEELHLSDQDLLMAADGELSTRRSEQVRVHLAGCWDCRARMAAVEGTIADFARAHRQALDSQLPPVAGPRALLRAQLAELAAQPKAATWRRFFQFTGAARAVAYVCLAACVALAAGLLLFRHSGVSQTNSPVAFEGNAVPDHHLTPGATRRIAISDVCAMPHEEVIRDVPTSVRQEVFQEYGIANARAKDYEIDFLIAPGLGGVEDIHNLWPEPYTSPMWNAHVKDDLEEHLHQMVCAGKVDLSTAQNDIATNWIAAYKKYFHTDKPLAERSYLLFAISPHPL